MSSNYAQWDYRSTGDDAWLEGGDDPACVDAFVVNACVLAWGAATDAREVSVKRAGQLVASMMDATRARAAVAFLVTWRLWMPAGDRFRVPILDVITLQVETDTQRKARNRAHAAKDHSLCPTDDAKKCPESYTTPVSGHVSGHSPDDVPPKEGRSEGRKDFTPTTADTAPTTAAGASLSETAPPPDHVAATEGLTRGRVASYATRYRDDELAGEIYQGLLASGRQHTDRAAVQRVVDEWLADRAAVPA